MKESLEKTAILEDIEPETFTHFAEFCYKGNYWCTLKPILFEIGMLSTQNFANRLQSAGLSNYHCHYCGEGGLSISENRNFPRCSSSCVAGSNRCVICCSAVSIRTADPRVCKGCAINYRLDIPKPSPVKSKLWQEFKDRKFDGVGMTDYELRQYLKNCVPKDEETDQIVSHARLFVFADRYDIQPLQALSLHKLHRDLVQFKPSEDNAADLVALIEYVYENTMGAGEVDGYAGIPEGSLRDVVALYAACNAELLQRTSEFRRLLLKGGEVVNDYTCLLMKRLE